MVPDDLVRYRWSSARRMEALDGLGMEVDQEKPVGAARRIEVRRPAWPRSARGAESCAPCARKP